MKSISPKRRFPPLWMVRRADADTFVVADANGVPLVYVPCGDDLRGICYAHSRLTSDEARRIANGVARLPEFMMRRKEFTRAAAVTSAGGHSSVTRRKLLDATSEIVSFLI